MLRRHVRSSLQTSVGPPLGPCPTMTISVSSSFNSPSSCRTTLALLHQHRLYHHRQRYGSGQQQQQQQQQYGTGAYRSNDAGVQHYGHADHWHSAPLGSHRSDADGRPRPHPHPSGGMGRTAGSRDGMGAPRHRGQSGGWGRATGEGGHTDGYSPALSPFSEAPAASAPPPNSSSLPPTNTYRRGGRHVPRPTGASTPSRSAAAPPASPYYSLASLSSALWQRVSSARPQHQHHGGGGGSGGRGAKALGRGQSDMGALRKMVENMTSTHGALLDGGCVANTNMPNDNVTSNGGGANTARRNANSDTTTTPATTSAPLRFEHKVRALVEAWGDEMGLDTNANAKSPSPSAASPAPPSIPSIRVEQGGTALPLRASTSTIFDCVRLLRCYVSLLTTSHDALRGPMDLWQAGQVEGAAVCFAAASVLLLRYHSHYNQWGGADGVAVEGELLPFMRGGPLCSTMLGMRMLAQVLDGGGGGGAGGKRHNNTINNTQGASSPHAESPSFPSSSSVPAGGLPCDPRSVLCDSFLKAEWFTRVVAALGRGSSVAIPGAFGAHGRDGTRHWRMSRAAATMLGEYPSCEGGEGEGRGDGVYINTGSSNQLHRHVASLLFSVLAVEWEQRLLLQYTVLQAPYQHQLGGAASDAAAGGAGNATQGNTSGGGGGGGGVGAPHSTLPPHLAPEHRLVVGDAPAQIAVKALEAVLLTVLEGRCAATANNTTLTCRDGAVEERLAATVAVAFNVLSSCFDAASHAPIAEVSFGGRDSAAHQQYNSAAPPTPTGSTATTNSNSKVSDEAFSSLVKLKAMLHEWDAVPTSSNTSSSGGGSGSKGRGGSALVGTAGFSKTRQRSVREMVAVLDGRHEAARHRVEAVRRGGARGDSGDNSSTHSSIYWVSSLFAFPIAALRQLPIDVIVAGSCEQTNDEGRRGMPPHNHKAVVILPPPRYSFSTVGEALQSVVLPLVDVCSNIILTAPLALPSPSQCSSSSSSSPPPLLSSLLPQCPFGHSFEEWVQLICSLTVSLRIHPCPRALLVMVEWLQTHYPASGAAAATVLASYTRLGRSLLLATSLGGAEWDVLPHDEADHRGRGDGLVAVAGGVGGGGYPSLMDHPAVSVACQMAMAAHMMRCNVMMSRRGGGGDCGASPLSDAVDDAMGSSIGGADAEGEPFSIDGENDDDVFLTLLSDNAPPVHAGRRGDGIARETSRRSPPPPPALFVGRGERPYNYQRGIAYLPAPPIGLAVCMALTATGGTHGGASDEATHHDAATIIDCAKATLSIMDGGGSSVALAEPPLAVLAGLCALPRALGVLLPAAPPISTRQPPSPPSSHSSPHHHAATCVVDAYTAFDVAKLVVKLADVFETGQLGLAASMARRGSEGDNCGAEVCGGPLANTEGISERDCSLAPVSSSSLEPHRGHAAAAAMNILLDHHRSQSPWSPGTAALAAKAAHHVLFQVLMPLVTLQQRIGSAHQRSGGGDGGGSPSSSASASPSLGTALGIGSGSPLLWRVVMEGLVRSYRLWGEAVLAGGEGASGGLDAATAELMRFLLFIGSRASQNAISRGINTPNRGGGSDAMVARRAREVPEGFVCATLLYEKLCRDIAAAAARSHSRHSVVVAHPMLAAYVRLCAATNGPTPISNDTVAPSFATSQHHQQQPPPHRPLDFVGVFTRLCGQMGPREVGEVTNRMPFSVADAAAMADVGSDVSHNTLSTSLAGHPQHYNTFAKIFADVGSDTIGW